LSGELLRAADLLAVRLRPNLLPSLFPTLSSKSAETRQLSAPTAAQFPHYAKAIRATLIKPSDIAIFVSDEDNFECSLSLKANC
jgi:hypothetical protein